MSQGIKGLFPITQAADACGLSRSTLMRMEESGLLMVSKVVTNFRVFFIIIILWHALKYDKYRLLKKL